MKNCEIIYGKSKARMHVAIRSIAKQAFMTCENLHDFTNAIKYGLEEWGNTHARRKQTLASVLFDVHEDGRSCICTFMTLNNGRETIFSCGLLNIKQVSVLEARKAVLQRKLDSNTDFFIALGITKQIEVIDEQLKVFKAGW